MNTNPQTYLCQPPHLHLDACQELTPENICQLFPGLKLDTLTEPLRERLLCALRGAFRAGDIIWRGRMESAFIVNHKGARDLVTTVDHAAQKAIIEEIATGAPQDALLAEEELASATNTSASAEYLWIIDPLDGTTNFVRGHAHCATSIGVANDGQLQLGIVYAPFLGTLYLGIRGLGAYSLQGKLAVSSINQLEQALVATGFPYERNTIPALTRKVACLLENCADIRRNGAAALDLCHVASGLLDAYTETVKPWDMAAGLLIALEAGAHFTCLGTSLNQQEYLNCSNLLVANPSIFGELKELLIKTKSIE